MDRERLLKGLSDLGELIWNSVNADDKIPELLFELADLKLMLDKVDEADTRLASNAAEWIMESDEDPETAARQRQLVPSHEWSKYALFNFALDWVMDQALMRMKIEQKWPFQERDGFPKP